MDGKRDFPKIKRKDIGILIKHISEALEKNANNGLRGDGLTLTQSGFLTTLYAAPEHTLTMRELETIHRVSQPTAHGIVERLCQKKLVQTCDDKNSKAKRVTLCPAAFEKCKLGIKHMTEAESKLRENLTKEEQETLYRLLEKVRDGICG